MPVFSYKKAKELNLINEANRERLLTYLLAQCDQIEFGKKASDHVATELGGASNSARNAMIALFKQLVEKGCAIEKPENGGEEGKNQTVKATPKKAAPKKRKAGDENGDIAEIAAKTVKKSKKDDLNVAVPGGAGPEDLLIKNEETVDNAVA